MRNMRRLMPMSKTNPTCRQCGVKLNDENWYPSQQKRYQRICKECQSRQAHLWRAANRDRDRAAATMRNRQQGHLPLNENKECSAYLGVHIAERVLSYVFKNVKRMPYRRPGYDFICNHGKKIDVKSACLRRTQYPRWGFKIKRNTIADFFLCLAFDNREDLTPLHVWLLPGNKFAHLSAASIAPSTIHKWDEYALDTSKVNECCELLK